MVISEIIEKTDQQQAELIADYFSSIPNEYNPIKDDDVQVPQFTDTEVLQFSQSEVWLLLTKMKTNKATVRGDLPAKIIKHFAAYLGKPS